MRSAVAVTSRGNSNSAVRELVDSGVSWPTPAPVEIPLYRKPLLVETDEDGADANEESVNGEHTWKPRVMLPKYHQK